jgi:hypothetical protein
MPSLFSVTTSQAFPKRGYNFIWRTLIMRTLPFFLLLVFLAACQPTPAMESPTPSETPIPTNTPVPTATATLAPSPTPTESPEEAAARLAQAVLAGEVSLAEATAGMGMEERLDFSQLMVGIEFANASPPQITIDGKTFYLKQLPDGTYDWSTDRSPTKLNRILPAAIDEDGNIYYADSSRGTRTISMERFPFTDEQSICLIEDIMRSNGEENKIPMLHEGINGGRYSVLPAIVHRTTADSSLKIEGIWPGLKTMEVLVPDWRGDSLVGLRIVTVPVHMIGGYYQSSYDSGVKQFSRLDITNSQPDLHEGMIVILELKIGYGYKYQERTFPDDIYVSGMSVGGSDLIESEYLWIAHVVESIYIPQQ